MEKQFIHQFENMFGLLFNTLTDFQKTSSDQDDDGIYHYVDIKNKNVYSFDTFDQIWLEKNLYKSDILNRMKLPY